MNKKSDRLTYEQFLAAFDEGHPNNYAPGPQDHPYPQVANSDLQEEICNDKMRKKIVENLELVTKVSKFIAFNSSLL
jgi:hypothetical protein